MAMADTLIINETLAADEGDNSFSWSAVFAGAFVAAAVSFILISLGAGVGLSMTSPHPGVGASAKGVLISAALWTVLSQWVGFAAGGFLAGRMRTRWAGLHTHEASFRDSVHGAVVWAVGVVVGTGLLLVASMVTAGTGTIAASNLGQGAATQQAGPYAYYTDGLFRAGTPGAPAAGSAAATATAADAQTAEAGRIFAQSVKNGALAPEDRDYLAQVVASRTGLTQDEARKRVDEADRKVREAADQARKAAAQLAFLTFVSLLIGCFAAMSAAYFGGRERDEVV